MRGCRPFSRAEIVPCLEWLSRLRYGLRERAWFALGIYSGFRISETLSLRVGQVIQVGRPLKRVTVARSKMKGHRASRSMVFHPQAQAAVAEWLEYLYRWRDPWPDLYLFQSQKGLNAAITRRHAARILARMALALGLEPKIGTHSLRKTFALAVYSRELDAWTRGGELPIRIVMKALGHRSVDVTERYLGLDVRQVDTAVAGLDFDLGGGAA